MKKALSKTANEDVTHTAFNVLLTRPEIVLEEDI
jgi:hypothetical protein